jgi:hypothetical protein
MNRGRIQQGGVPVCNRRNGMGWPQCLREEIDSLSIFCKPHYCECSKSMRTVSS